MRRRHREAGQAILLVLLAASIFLFAAVGLAIDGSHLYAQRQMAQAAADAAAQAGVLSMFNGSNATGAHAFSTGGSFTCATSDARTPCYYAQTMNGFNGAGDTVTVAFPTTSRIQVTVQRSVDTTLLGMLGTSASTIGASGTAEIVNIAAPIPIVVTHPTLAGAMAMNGNPSVTICGGPGRSIEVNSSSTTAFSAGGSWSIDLSQSTCTPAGTGTDFGVFGGPSSRPSNLNTGTTGKYVQPASPVLDPLASVTPPPIPAAAPAKTPLGNGVSGCPPSPKKGCQLYSPGLYSSGIHVHNETAVFKPGIYYITSNGLSNGANGDMVMATGFTDTAAGTNTGWTGNVLFYNTGSGTLDIAAANSDATLVGSPVASSYKGILFFQDPNAAAATHNLGGGGAITLIGTIYLTNTLATMTATSSHYQSLNLQGGSGSGTNIQGEIIAGGLSLGGNGSINMSLSPASSFFVRQVALVN